MLNKVDYDEYNGFVIVARSKKRAIEVMLVEHIHGGNVSEDNIESIEQVDLNKEKEILSSFHAG